MMRRWCEDDANANANQDPDKCCSEQKLFISISFKRLPLPSSNPFYCTLRVLSCSLDVVYSLKRVSDAERRRSKQPVEAPAARARVQWRSRPQTPVLLAEYSTARVLVPSSIVSGRVPREQRGRAPGALIANEDAGSRSARLSRDCREGLSHVNCAIQFTCSYEQWITCFLLIHLILTILID